MSPVNVYRTSEGASQKLNSIILIHNYWISFMFNVLLPYFQPPDGAKSQLTKKVASWVIIIIYRFCYYATLHPVFYELCHLPSDSSSRSWGSCPRTLLPLPCRHRSHPSSSLCCRDPRGPLQRHQRLRRCSRATLSDGCPMLLLEFDVKLLGI